MDRLLIDQKLETLRHCLTRVAGKCPPDATTLARMGEAFSTLARMGYIDDTTATNLRRGVGFRNIAVHNYDSVDWDIVHAICQRQLDDFRAFASKIGTLLDEP